jgi:hypothetical protein
LSEGTSRTPNFTEDRSDIVDSFPRSLKGLGRPSKKVADDVEAVDWLLSECDLSALLFTSDCKRSGGGEGWVDEEDKEGDV